MYCELRSTGPFVQPSLCVRSASTDVKTTQYKIHQQPINKRKQTRITINAHCLTKKVSQDVPFFLKTPAEKAIRLVRHIHAKQSRHQVNGRRHASNETENSYSSVFRHLCPIFLFSKTLRAGAEWRRS